MKNLLIYNPTDRQIGRLHDFANPINTWDNEIIAELNVGHHDDDLNEWLREIVYQTDIVANIRSLDSPNKRHKFQDLCPSSKIKGIINSESPGGDIRKYTSDLYGGVDKTIQFDLNRSEDVIYNTGFEPLSIDGLREILNLGFCDETRPNKQWYPTAGEVIAWNEDINAEYSSVECGVIAAVHLKDQVVDNIGITGFVIYNADDEVMDWARKYWDEEDETNMKYTPSEFDLTDRPNQNAIRMWWD